MQESAAHKIIRVSQGRSEHLQRPVVEEYPLRLRVNGKELATLVCSPHKLNFLLIGFFRLQGFISSLDEIQSLGVCSDFGLAEVRLNGELPERLQPTLTSGCGTGIAYNLPDQLLSEGKQRPRHYDSESLLRLMKELNDLTEQYRSHGGIHSAAIGDRDGVLMLHAEDIGRHNTLDRVAGEALFRGINLQDKMLVTSGRVSTEMVAKAARLGIGLLATRTSPTDKAIQLCEQAGITLVGYVRGGNMEVYSHSQQLRLNNNSERITGVTGVILAGGESRRMGSDKSLLPVAGARFIDHVYQRMASLFDEVVIVTNSPDLYNEIPCRKVPDIYYAQGSLAGVHSGLAHAKSEKIFVVGCDMPFISPAVVREICSHAAEGDLVIPHSSSGHEPLHALYSKACLPAMERVLDAGLKRILLFFDQVKLVELPASVVRQHDPQEKSFQNINTPEDYFRLRGTLVDEYEIELPLKRGNDNN
ncbi:FdhD protein [Malonomonas rubra DSM 5091]|uniref:Multifunctional fusion protein n=1 Tax=Malonomonas rubra DSM 5091 TaxID=1122189 RepID=A0A1M6JQK5_MALRU|nr:formate dehydrogenase accessory sulfurtransferase FdhD [Malonomonas rubra]SHJ48987.1 FdhD protein [Malonomonas rubra DSM 5091]